MELERSTPLPRHNVAIVPRGAAPPALAVPPPSANAPASDWQHYLFAVRRRKWLVLFVTLLGTAAGVLATRFLDPRYSAKAMLWVEGGGGSNGRDHTDRDRDMISSGQEVIEAPGWVELVTANAVLDSVVQGLRLYLQPDASEDSSALVGFGLVAGSVQSGHYQLSVDDAGRAFTLTLADGTVVQHGIVGDSVGSALGFGWRPPPTVLTPGRRVNFAVAAPYEVAQHLAATLSVRLDPAAASFLRLELKGTNPAQTTTIVNAVAHRVVAVAAEMKRQKFEELAKILGEQEQHAENALRTAEGALTEFQVRMASESQDAPVGASAGTNAGGPLSASSLEMHLALDQIRRDRRGIEAILQAVPKTGVPIDALTSITAVRESPPLNQALQEVTQKQAELRALRYRYTAASAPVQQIQADLDALEQRAVPALARQLVSELMSREAVLAPRVDSQFRFLRRVPPLTLRQARLERDVTSAQEVYNGVGRRYQEARLALVSSLPDIRILDAAVVPRRPANNFGPLIVALSFMTSLGLVVVGVTVMDRLDPKIRHPDQVTQGMRLPILAAVPHVGWRLPAGLSDGTPEVIEALRALRVRVLHALGTDEPFALTVTSTSPAEGKSFVSVNLALSFAYAGYKTLLIDGDVRRGAQHRVLDVPRGPGLTDVLAGDAAWEGAVRETSYAGLSFMGSGTRLHRAPELLLSPSLKELMAQLCGTYRVVIVDSPPLAAGVDPVILGTSTGNLLLVVRSGATDIQLAMSKLDVVDSLPVRTIGVVLNDVRGSSAFKYYTYDLSAYAEQPDDGPSAIRDKRPSLLGGRSA